MFSPLTQEKIEYYVYCLNNPESGETFYIGKGRWNRVFAHANGDLEKDSNIEKIEVINDIKSKGEKVEHWIIRYGLSEKEAFEVEAALIDFVGIDNISNRVKGHSVERGKISCEELDIILGAKKIEIQDNIMIIKINAKYRSDMNEEEIYGATNKWWKVNKKNAEKVEYVLSVHNGIVRGVFKPIFWYKAEDSNRMGFEGKPAPTHIKEKYMLCSIEEYIKRGKANPIQYLFLNKTDSEIVEIEETKDLSGDDAAEILEKAILIKINSSYHEGMSKEEIYRATRGNWKLSLEKAKNSEYVFSIVNGTIIEVFKPLSWDKCSDSDRIVFSGIIAPEDIRSKYIDKTVKHQYVKGEANPCKYLNL